MSNMPAKEVLERVYGESKRSGERFLHLSPKKKIRNALPNILETPKWSFLLLRDGQR